MNTTENNKLIAEFMGVTPNNNGWYDGLELQRIGLPFAFGAMGNGTSELKFNTSWDWLMPVLKKIDSYANEVMSIDDFDNYRDNYRMINSPTHYNIDCIYKQVVEFIKWYNNQNKPLDKEVFIERMLKEIKEANLGDLQDFIIDEFQNLKTFDENKERFVEWLNEQDQKNWNVMGSFDENGDTI